MNAAVAGRRLSAVPEGTNGCRLSFGGCMSFSGDNVCSDKIHNSRTEIAVPARRATELPDTWGARAITCCSTM